jgi:hypothetical protein
MRLMPLLFCSCALRGSIHHRSKFARFASNTSDVPVGCIRNAVTEHVPFSLSHAHAHAHSCLSSVFVFLWHFRNMATRLTDYVSADVPLFRDEHIYKICHAAVIMSTTFSQCVSHRSPCCSVSVTVTSHDSRVVSYIWLDMEGISFDDLSSGNYAEKSRSYEEASCRTTLAKQMS